MEQFTAAEEDKIGQYFKISVLLKGAISLAEMIAGVALLFLPLSFFVDLAIAIAGQLLPLQISAFISSQLLELLHQFANISGLFIAVYIFSRGFIKVALIWAMLKNKLWAYPSSLVVLGLFVMYQIFELIKTGSLAIIALTIFDLVVMYFIWREYQVLKFETKNN
jgi:uncharacterized membrane protein